MLSLLSDDTRKFQLHHTGIKTPILSVTVKVEEEFQLHHTGIKTLLRLIFSILFSGYFNCTIQELKLSSALKRAWSFNAISIAPYRN